MANRTRQLDLGSTSERLPARLDQVDEAPNVRALVDGMRLELVRLRDVLRATLPQLPTDELRRIRGGADGHSPAAPGTASIAELVNDQVSTVLQEEIDAVLAARRRD